MTALFAVVLVLFVLSSKQKNDVIKATKAQLKTINDINENLEVLMKDTAFFI